MTEYREPSTTGPSIDLPTPGRALTIGAHPDDAEFGAGGTLAKWAAAGCAVTMLIMTDGSKGTWDQDLPAEALVAARRAEQAAAAEALGATRVVMLDHVDGELETTIEVRAELAWWIRSVRPDVVLTHDPWRRYMFHADHRAAGMATVDGVVAARDHLFFPDQLGNGIEPHRPGALLLWAPDGPDHWEDVDGFVDTKVDALVCHSSQGTTTMNGAEQSAQAASAFRAEIHERATTVGAAVGRPAAESFRLMVP
jgi:LmbE family N-acetylglucosaminyl deacetylase